ncbi:ribosomal protein S5 domain 2-type protein [Hyaloraphidium curvatum]|nr:ribosomal protein S5 domain 2-type protein [Hyaloraphidium curvatum]
MHNRARARCRGCNASVGDGEHAKGLLKHADSTLKENVCVSCPMDPRAARMPANPILTSLSGCPVMHASLGATRPTAAGALRASDASLRAQTNIQVPTPLARAYPSMAAADASGSSSLAPEPPTDALLAAFRAAFPRHSSAPLAFSAPGGVELCGAHTYEQKGRAVAVAVDPPTSLVCAPSGSPVFTLASLGGERVSVDLASLEPVEAEKGTVEALIRGVASGLSQKGYRTAGLDAAVGSAEPVAPGFPSSASLGVVLCCAFLGALNDPPPNSIPPMTPTDIAMVAHRAEMLFFGRPWGPATHLASAHGSVVAVDYSFSPPRAEKVPMDLPSAGLSLLLASPSPPFHPSPALLAALHHDMSSIARWCSLGEATALGDCNGDEFLDMVPQLRRHGVPDGAVLRALHFFEESARADDIAAVLRSPAPGFSAVLDAVLASGRSAAMYLQALHEAPEHQPAELALAITEQFLASRGAKGAWRAGEGSTVLAIVPGELAGELQEVLEEAFGPGCAVRASVRATGAGKTS